MTQEEINRIIVEKGQGKCWHERITKTYSKYGCKKCAESSEFYADLSNPDFSEWNNFGELLKVARNVGIKIMTHPDLIRFVYKKKMYSLIYTDIDQIPLIVSVEVAAILEEKK